MALEKEQKIKFWISTFAKVLVVLFLLVRIYDYFSHSEENIEPKDAAPKKSKLQIVDSNIVEDPSTTIYSKDETNLKDAPKKKDVTTVLSKIIKLRGQPLIDAKVLIDNCSECSVSTSNTKGFISIVVPTTIYEKNLLHNFYVYSNDTLVFERAMRFTDVQFNIY